MAAGLFENDVKMYGTQTFAFVHPLFTPFENDVKMYGTQTWCYQTHTVYQFENDVKMYGTQTAGMPEFQSSRLRMM